MRHPALPPVERARRHRTDRRRRGRAAAVVLIAGVVNLLSAAGPPLHRRLHLHVLVAVVPLVVSETASTLVALAGIALLGLARGIRRGQRAAWAIACILLATTAILHLVERVHVLSTLIALSVLWLLVATRDAFRTGVDRPSRRAGLLALCVGALSATVAATVAVEVTMRVDRDGPAPPLARTAAAFAERLVGLQSTALPHGVSPAIGRALMGVGITLLVLAVGLAFRPVVDRRRAASAPSRQRARGVVARYGAGTLDYFALRHDKQHFFHGDTLVTYAVHHGVCLVSPDPIGPESGRLEAWAAFRAFADDRGWKVAALGTGEGWLATYAGAGMRHCYLGDEAIVAVQEFQLGGGRHKSLRQAVNRIARHGYTATFHDPSTLDAALVTQLETLAAEGRRGSVERGFSMTLGRLCDPDDDGLLLAVARDRAGAPVAFCQFVPAPGIGGYSLDLMRRGGGEHPNGLVDFLVVATIEHLRTRDMTGLALNFAAMRALVAGDGGRLPVRALRTVLVRLSRSMQIESLWRFTAKYDPVWAPRHLVFDRLGDLPAIGLAVARAESFVELPLLGRLVAWQPAARLAAARLRLLRPS
ncbi:MAG: phosphatidylglycerol lysyltransferase domain-containing protein [Actinomycetota bacterium]|nr:phosphatidylglycerol lysyltransferase domain-containing protein [Actinomycetota bacterium]